MLPPVSVPTSKGEPPALIIAAAPPLLPPGVLEVSNGLFVCPKIRLSVLKERVNSGRVGFTHQDRAFITQALDTGGIFARSKFPAAFCSPGRYHVEGVQRVLDRHGNTKEFPGRLAALQGYICALCILHRDFRLKPDNGIQGRIDSFDSVEEQFRQLFACGLLAANCFSKVSDR